MSNWNYIGEGSESESLEQGLASPQLPQNTQNALLVKIAKIGLWLGNVFKRLGIGAIFLGLIVVIFGALFLLIQLMFLATEVLIIPYIGKLGARLVWVGIGAGLGAWGFIAWSREYTSRVRIEEREKEKERKANARFQEIEENRSEQRSLAELVYPPASRVTRGESVPLQGAVMGVEELFEPDEPETTSNPPMNVCEGCSSRFTGRHCNNCINANNRSEIPEIPACMDCLHNDEDLEGYDGYNCLECSYFSRFTPKPIPMSDLESLVHPTPVIAPDAPEQPLESIKVDNAVDGLEL